MMSSSLTSSLASQRSLMHSMRWLIIIPCLCKFVTCTHSFKLRSIATILVTPRNYTTLPRITPSRRAPSTAPRLMPLPMASCAEEALGRSTALMFACLHRHYRTSLRRRPLLLVNLYVDVVVSFSSYGRSSW
jgi:hypothetical protein